MTELNKASILCKPLSKYIDHTLLKPEAQPEDIIRICFEAREYDFASVCVNSCYAALVTDQLQGTDVKTCCVVGFPLGAASTASKAREAAIAIDDGATEIDMVINVGLLKSENYDAVLSDINAVVEACSERALLKVIIETCLLTDEEKIKACQLSEQAGADFVKTSTGFSRGGATVEDVKLMRASVSDNIQVKAAGGIRNLKTTLEMIEAGADRIGASAGVAIINEYKGVN